MKLWLEESVDDTEERDSKVCWVCVYVPVNDKVMIKEGKALVRYRDSGGFRTAEILIMKEESLHQEM